MNGEVDTKHGRLGDIACCGVKSIITPDYDAALRIAAGSHLQLWRDDAQSDLWIDHFDVRNELDILDLKQLHWALPNTTILCGHLEYILDDDESSYYEDLLMERFQDLLDCKEEDLNCQKSQLQADDSDHESVTDRNSDPVNEILNSIEIDEKESTSCGYQSNRTEFWVRPERESYPLPAPWNIPNEVRLPMSKKQFDVIILTVKNIRQKGPQFEIFLKLKQSDTNILFDFLNYESDLFDFFQHMRNLSEESFFAGLESTVSVLPKSIVIDKEIGIDLALSGNEFPPGLTKPNDTELLVSVESSDAAVASNALSLLGNMYGDGSSSDEEGTVFYSSAELDRLPLHDENIDVNVEIAFDPSSSRDGEKYVISVDDYAHSNNEDINETLRDNSEVYVADDDDEGSNDETASTASLVNGLSNEIFGIFEEDDVTHCDSLVLFDPIDMIQDEEADVADRYKRGGPCEERHFNGATVETFRELEEGEESEDNCKAISIVDLGAVRSMIKDQQEFPKIYELGHDLDMAAGDINDETLLRMSGQVIGKDEIGDEVEDIHGNVPEYHDDDDDDHERTICSLEHTAASFIQHFPCVESTAPDSIYPTDVSNSDSDSDEDNQSDARSSPVPESRSSPVPESRSSPVPESRSNPVPELRSSPVPESRSSPVPESKSNPVPESRSSPVLNSASLSDCDESNHIDSGPISCTHFENNEDVYSVNYIQKRAETDTEIDIDNTLISSIELKNAMNVLDMEMSKLSSIDDDLLDEDIDESSFWGTAHLLKRQSVDRLKIAMEEKKEIIKKIDIILLEKSVQQKKAVRLRRARMLKNLFEEKAAAAKLETIVPVPLVATVGSSSAVDVDDSDDGDNSLKRSGGDDSSESNSSELDGDNTSKYPKASKRDEKSSRGRRGKRENKKGQSAHSRNMHSSDSDSERERRPKRRHRSRDRSSPRDRTKESRMHTIEKKKDNDKESKRERMRAGDRDRSGRKSIAAYKVSRRSRSRSVSRSRSRSPGRSRKKKRRRDNNRENNNDSDSEKVNRKNRVREEYENEIVDKSPTSSTASILFKDKIRLALGGVPLQRPIASQVIPQVAFRDRIQLALDALKEE